MTAPLALIVDDEPDIRELLELTLGRMSIDTLAAADVSSAKSLLQQHRFDMCLTDMKLPDGDGIELVEYAQQRFPDLPIAVITAHGSMEHAIKALKAGAFDFVSKPVDLHNLRTLVSTAIKTTKSFPTVDRRTRDELIGDSPAMQATRSTIAKVARSQAPVYISGESGTGKELVARLIHKKGPRAKEAFVPVNCGAIPNELMESEFFGHKKGSFTGALADKPGLFQAAHQGTLFFDEVADLPLHMQVKLLRAIQEKAVRPVGSSEEIHVDVRILSATHKDLAKLVAEGKFRQDLFYRINVIEVRVPSLRERSEDIQQLTQQILSKFGGEGEHPELDPEALNALKAYPFPGNVRELENILERASALCENNRIKPQDLRLPSNGGTDAPVAPDPLIDIDKGICLEEQLYTIEKNAILQALARTRQNKTAAAKLLGMSFRSLRYRLKKLNLE